MGARGRKSSAELAITPPTPLRVVPRAVNPPRPLGKAGKAAWDRLTDEYDFSDAASAEILGQVCAAIDLAETVDDPKLALQARAFISRTIGRLCE